MKKRPWHIEIPDDKEPTRVVKKSRAIGISFIAPVDTTKILRKNEYNKYAKHVYESYVIGVPYFGEEDGNE